MEADKPDVVERLTDVPTEPCFQITQHIISSSKGEKEAHNQLPGSIIPISSRREGKEHSIILFLSGYVTTIGVGFLYTRVQCTVLQQKSEHITNLTALRDCVKKRTTNLESTFAPLPIIAVDTICDTIPAIHTYPSL